MNQEEEAAIATARNYLSQDQAGAAWLAMVEVGAYINFSSLARNYFSRSGNWLLQRLHGYSVNGRPATFKPEEYTQLSSALRDIAQKLITSAERIDQANSPANTQ